MFLRSAPTDTLTTLFDKLDERTEALSANAADIRVAAEDGVIQVGDRELPYTQEGVIAIGNFLDVPTPFLKRLDADLSGFLLNGMLHRAPHNVVVKVADDGVRQLREPSNKDIEPRRVVEVASKVIGREAPVIEWERGLDAFRFDVVVADSADYGIGGDRAVGDLTKGGLRFAQDLRRNLAPSVQPFNYRLLCTNGMTTFDGGLKIDARGGTVDEVLAQLEAAAQNAFGKVEADIRHFYDLRNERLTNPERTLNRMARERGLADRARVTLIDRLPSVVDEQGEATMFDLVNLITNAANDPAVRRWGARLELETFGGSVVTTHADRCATCQSALH